MWKKDHLAISTLSYADYPLASLLRQSIVGLLRTAATDGESGSDRPHERASVSEWDFVFLPAMSDGISRISTHAITAWAFRIATDVSAGRNVESAADKLLSAQVPVLFKKDEQSRLVWEFVLAECSEAAFSSFTSRYVEETLSGAPMSTFLNVTSALVARDASSSKPYHWLASVFDDGGDPEILDHFLDALLRQLSIGSVLPESPLLATAQLLEDQLAVEDPDKTLIAILGQHLHSNAMVGNGFWQVAAAVEEVGLFSTITSNGLPNLSTEHPILRSLMQLMPWLGADLPPNADYLRAPGEFPLAILDREGHRSEGGFWYRLETDKPIFFHLERPSRDLQVAILDENRSLSIGHISELESSQRKALYLAPGTYAVAFRKLQSSDRAPQHVTVKTEEVPLRLSVGSEREATVVSQSSKYLIDTEGRTGFVWLRVALEANSSLRVETKSSPSFAQSELPISPLVVVYLLSYFHPQEYTDFREFLLSSDAEMHAEVLRAEHLWSRGRRNGDILTDLVPLHNEFVEAARRRPFSMSEFAFLVESSLRGGLLRSAFSSIFGLESDLSGDGYQRLSDELLEYSPGLHRRLTELRTESDIDTFVGLVDLSTGREVVFDDDGGDSWHARLHYVARSSEELLIRVSGCCPAPLHEGVKFFLEVDVGESGTF